MYTYVSLFDFTDWEKIGRKQNEDNRESKRCQENLRPTETGINVLLRQGTGVPKALLQS